MSEPTIPDDDRQQRLEEAMAEYLIAVDAGRRSSPSPSWPATPTSAPSWSRSWPTCRRAALVEPLLPAGAASPVPGSTPEPNATRQRHGNEGGGVDNRRRHNGRR